MKIGIIGSGYVGLVTGACLAHLGHTVTCVDNDPDKIRTLKSGNVPFYEPGLHEMIENNVAAGRLLFTADISKVVNRCQVIFICVNTPSRPDGSADLSSVEKVTKSIAKHLRKFCLLVAKSTVPVETGVWIRKTLQRNVRAGVPFDVASNPEFLREGSAIQDFMRPDRIVIGVDTRRSEKILRELYASMKAPLIVTDIKSAELIKHAANSFLATKISFANGLSRICDAVGADVDKVTLGMGLDPRIGSQFLRAGIGFGGACFPKDLKAFLHISEELGVPFSVLAEVIRINDTQARYFSEKIMNRMKSLKGKTLGVLGLAFKSDTDDMRNAPSLTILPALQKEGAKIQVYDPQAVDKARPHFKNLKYATDPYEALRGAHAVVLLTEWKEFLSLDWKRVRRGMKGRFFFDGRNLFNPAEMKKQGFQYFSIGRPSV